MRWDHNRPKFVNETAPTVPKRRCDVAARAGPERLRTFARGIPRDSLPISTHPLARRWLIRPRSCERLLPSDAAAGTRPLFLRDRGRLAGLGGGQSVPVATCAATDFRPNAVASWRFRVRTVASPQRSSSWARCAVSRTSSSGTRQAARSGCLHGITAWSRRSHHRLRLTSCWVGAPLRCAHARAGP